ncbi:MAG: hypothetical protein ACRDGJ_08755, partial [Candidatus Limnocylindria bacterium]
LGLVDRQADAVAEARALGDANIRSNCRGHRLNSRTDAGERAPSARAFGPTHYLVLSTAARLASPAAAYNLRLC